MGHSTGLGMGRLWYGRDISCYLVDYVVYVYGTSPGCSG